MKRNKEKRNKKYRIRIQKKPKLMKIFAVRLFITTAVLGLIAAGITAYAIYDYHNYIISSGNLAFDALYSRLGNSTDERSKDTVYNAAGLRAEIISDSGCIQMAGAHGMVKALTDINFYIFHRGLDKCLEVQIYDEAGNFKCSTRDSIFVLIRFTGEEQNRIYVCNHVSEKYDLKTIDNIVYYQTIQPEFYVKEDKFEFFIEGITDENELLAQGYQHVNQSDTESIFYNKMNLAYDSYDKEKIDQKAKKSEESFDIHFQGQDMSVKLITISYFWYDYGKPVVLIYTVILLLSVITALLISYKTYMSRTLQYENDLYRRSITNAMAHDLKSPLMVISGYVQNILAGTKPEKNDDYLNAIQNTVNDMDRMIVNILNLSKSEYMMETANISTVSIKGLLSECIQKYAQHIEKAEINIKVEGDCSLACDEIMMKQAIDNILSNAVKYTASGSKILIELKEHEMIFRNKFSDSIDVEPSRLLEPFVKGDNAKKGQRGSGIGLSIADHIFQQYGYTTKIHIEGDEFILSVTS